MKKRMKIAIALFVAPFVLLVTVLVLYAVMNFWMVSAGPEAGEGAVAAAIAGRLVLGLLGVVGVAGFIFGWPIGLYFAMTADKEKK